MNVLCQWENSSGRERCNWDLKAYFFRQLDTISMRDTKFFHSAVTICHKCYCFSTQEWGKAVRLLHRASGGPLIKKEEVVQCPYAGATCSTAEIVEMAVAQIILQGKEEAFLFF